MKTEMSRVDTSSWFLTVTFDCHLAWHFHCGRADVHIFGWIGLMLPIQLCIAFLGPYNSVSALCVHTTGLGWANVFGSSRTMTLEWGVYTIVPSRGVYTTPVGVYRTLVGVYTTPVLKCPSWARWYAVYPNKDTFVTVETTFNQNDFLGFPDSYGEA